MTRLVLDASVLMASLIAKGPTRALLLGAHPLELHAPEVISGEVEKHLPRVAQRTSNPLEVVRTLVGDILARVEVAPVTLYASRLPEALRRCKAAHAHHDEAYVALADVLACPIWTYDKDFRRIRGLKVLSTSEVARLADLGG